MFQNFKLSKFLQSFSIGQTKQQSIKSSNTQYSAIIKAHDIENFYQDFLLVKTINTAEQSFMAQSLSQSNTSYISLTSNSFLQNYGYSEIMYLKDRKSATKFVQVGKQTYDHIAIKFKFFNKNQEQKLKQNLNQQLQLKQSLMKNESKQLDQTNIFVNLLVNYYIEQMNLICSSFTYIYLVFEKWSQGVFQKLNNMIRNSSSKTYIQDYCQTQKNKIQINSQPIYKKSDDNKSSSNASTFISIRNNIFPFAQKKLSPINTIDNISESRYLSKSQIGHKNQKFKQVTSFPSIKDVNMEQKNNLKVEIARQLLGMIKNVILGLSQQISINIKRSDLKICNLIYQQKNYKLSNSLTPYQVLMQIEREHMCREVQDGRYFGKRCLQKDNNEKKMSSISFPSPEQLSQIIKYEQKWTQQQLRERDEYNKLRLSSLLFKVGMISLQIWCYYQWKLNRKQTLNSIDTKSCITQWKSVMDKVYTVDQSCQSFIDSNQSKFTNSSLKIDWLQLSNLLKAIESSQQYTYKTDNNHSLSHPIKDELTLFVKVLRCLLNRSATERNKTLPLIQHKLQKITKSQQRVNNHQNHYPLNHTYLTHPLSYVTPKQTSFIPSFIKLNQTSAQSKVDAQNFTHCKSVSIKNNQSDIFSKETQNLNPFTYFHKTNHNYKQPIIHHRQKQQDSKLACPTPNPTVKTNYLSQQIISNEKKPSQNYYFPINIKHSLPQANIHSFVQTKSQYQNQNNNNNHLQQNQFNKSPINSTNYANVTFSVQKNNQSIQKDLKTPYFGQNQQDKQLFKFNSVSQETKKNLFQKSQTFTVQNNKTLAEICNKQQDNVLNKKQTSEHSLSQLSELEEQSPINKKPSTLSKPQQQQSEFPQHLPQSSKQFILLSNINSEIEKDNILIEEDNQTLDQKIKDNLQQMIQQQQQVYQQTQNKPEIQQNHQKIKLTNYHLHQFQNLQFIQGNQPQTISQAEYVIESYKGGGSYEGYLKNKKRNGYGKLYYHDGSRYEGEWLEDQMNGYGKLFYSSGLLAYQGNWVKDQFHGSGKVYNDSPTMLDDSYDYTNFNNLQQQWAYYQGQLQHDLKQGHGVIMLENGEYFEGDFHTDRINGQGKFVNLQGQTIHGIWKDNVLIQLIEI